METVSTIEMVELTEDEIDSQIVEDMIARGVRFTPIEEAWPDFREFAFV